MKKYTQEDFNGFEIVKGLKICPTGEYSGIKIGDSCTFDTCCSFNDCQFGECCEFNDFCKFAEGSEFGDYCKFNDFCEFGKGCEFAKGCRIGDCGKFENDCNFGTSCSFKEFCSWGRNCSFENGVVVNGRFLFLRNLGSTNRGVYLYIDENKKLFLRAGCFFGDLEEFNQHCKTEETNKKTMEQYLFLFKIGQEFFEISDQC